MNMIDLESGSYIEPGKFYADLLEEESPIAVIIYIEAGSKKKNIIDEYDLADESLKLQKNNTEGQAPCEGEYEAFIKWLKEHKKIKTIYITEELKSCFYFPLEEEGYIDEEDGMYKFHEDEDE